MLASRLETWEEARVIFAFPRRRHRRWKSSRPGACSWIYPEALFLRIAGVPLFSGFMYAAVGSYIALLLAYPRCSLRALSADSGCRRCWRGSTRISSRTTFIPDIRIGLFYRRASLHLLAGACSTTGLTEQERPMPMVAWVRAGRAVHMVCRKSRHVRPCMGLSKPATMDGIPSRWTSWARGIS